MDRISTNSELIVVLAQAAIDKAKNQGNMLSGIYEPAVEALKEITGFNIFPDKLPSVLGATQSYAFNEGQNNNLELGIYNGSDIHSAYSVDSMLETIQSLSPNECSCDPSEITMDDVKKYMRRVARFGDIDNAANREDNFSIPLSDIIIDLKIRNGITA